jgi:citrate synthase
MSPQSKNNSLSVRDNRTGNTYEIPIANNAIDASAFKQMKAPRHNEPEEHETERGLRVFDRGFLNTAVISSNITYIDGTNGILRYRGYPIQELAEKSNHLETAYLLIYGTLPTAAQYQHFHKEIMHHATVHVDAEELFRYPSSLALVSPQSNPRDCRSFRYGACPINTSPALYLIPLQMHTLCQF